MRDVLAAQRFSAATPVADLRLLAVDIETTGLDPRRDRIVSIGWVPVDGMAIDLGGAASRIVRSTGPVGDSVRFHGITDDEVSAGVALDEALADLLVALQGRGLLAHFSQIEEGFLAQACRSVYGVQLAGLDVVDTLEIQRRLLGRGFDDLKRGSLRLWEARRRYGLPRYRAHDALVDALACAELYLAQVAELSHGRALTWKDVQA